MIFSCQNMTLLNTMLVLKLHEVYIYFHFQSYFNYYSTCSLFLAIFPLMNYQLFLLYTPLHSYLTLSVRQLLYFSIYISLVSVATIYIPVPFFFNFPYCGCNLFLPHLILVLYCVPLFVTVTLFADDTKVIFIYSIATYANMFFLYFTFFYA